MRIMHIISSLERGGAQAVLYELVVAFAQQRYEQSVVYFHAGPYVARFQALPIALHAIHGMRTPFDPLALVRLQRVVRERKPQIIHTILWAANWMGRLVATLHGIPCIMSLHNNYDQNGWHRILLDYCMPIDPTAIIAVSAEVKDSFLAFHTPLVPLAIIHNGVSQQSPHDTSTSLIRAHLGYTNEHFIIGSVGRFHPIKRYPLLLCAVAHLATRYPQVRLLLVGVGEEEKSLRALADQLGIASLIYWAIDTPASPYYSLMDCFILTSPKEGISLALLEAMSARVACAITSTTAPHAVLEHLRNGLVIQDASVGGIANAVEQLLHDQPLRHTLALRAQQTVQQHFTRQHMITAYDNLFNKWSRQCS